MSQYQKKGVFAMKKKTIILIIIGCIIAAGLAIIIANLVKTSEPSGPKVDIKLWATYTDKQNSISYDLCIVNNLDEQIISFTKKNKVIGFLLLEKDKKPPEKIKINFEEISTLINDEIQIRPGDFEYVIFINKIDNTE